MCYGIWAAKKNTMFLTNFPIIANSCSYNSLRLILRTVSFRQSRSHRLLNILKLRLSSHVVVMGTVINCGYAFLISSGTFTGSISFHDFSQKSVECSKFRWKSQVSGVLIRCTAKLRCDSSTFSFEESILWSMTNVPRYVLANIRVLTTGRVTCVLKYVLLYLIRQKGRIRCFVKPTWTCCLIVDMNTILYGYEFVIIMYEIMKRLPVKIDGKVSQCENYFAISMLHWFSKVLEERHSSTAWNYFS